jgi:hypothetical protein
MHVDGAINNTAIHISHCIAGISMWQDVSAQFLWFLIRLDLARAHATS